MATTFLKSHENRTANATAKSAHAETIYRLDDDIPLEKF